MDLLNSTLNTSMARVKSSWTTMYSDTKASNVYLHVRKTHDTEGIMCNLCGYRAGTQAILDKHMSKSHTGKHREFRCDLCDFTSEFAALLKQHKKKPHDKKCQYCDDFMAYSDFVLDR